MWDWDTEQPARKAAAQRSTGRWIGGGVGAVVVGALLIRLVVHLIAQDGGAADRQQPFTLRGSAAARPSAGIDDDQVRSAAEILLGGGLRPLSPNALNLGPAETLALGNRDNEVRLTPGAVGVRTDRCADGPLLTVAMTVTTVRGTVPWDPSALRVLGTGGQETQLLPQCVHGLEPQAAVDAGHPLAGELVFPASSPTWLAYAPGGGAPQARWRLA
ncbi:hypothetical protein [Paractinoplanes toevensis]|uniref:Uncharacterized protein n=1 Tax=Paractinoplanes toevensis TaxID=571911 RepID=A0A919T9E4_9ACTN|nr:hypothetical protein [Actinoplanes toevensis]GIM90897.1 hypothetical protein Ato02nite_026900 [Actinoplanes toevensis]